MQPPEPAAIVQAVMERLTEWPMTDNQWLDEPWRFPPPFQDVLMKPWHLPEAGQQWLQDHGSPAVLLGLLLRLPPHFMARVLGDLCRKRLRASYSQALAAGPGRLPRLEALDELARTLPAAVRFFARMAEHTIAIGQEGESFRTGTLVGAWETAQLLGLQDALGRVTQLKAETAATKLFCELVGKGGLGPQPGHRRRWQHAYESVVYGARTVLGWCPACGAPGVAGPGCPECPQPGG